MRIANLLAIFWPETVSFLPRIGDGSSSAARSIHLTSQRWKVPALLCAAAIGVMALIELIQRKPLDLGHGAEVE